jgi:hypothetical protein
MFSPRNSPFGTSDVPLLFCLTGAPLGLSGDGAGIKPQALLDRAGEPEGTLSSEGLGA